MRSKKGMSAMIAAILLIAFSITLGLMISNWVGGIVKKGIEKGESRVGSDIECMNIKVTLEDLGNKGVVIKNNGKKPVQGFVARIFTNTNVKVNQENDAIINSFAVLAYNPPEIQNATKLEVIPRAGIGLENAEIVDCLTRKVVINL